MFLLFQRIVHVFHVCNSHLHSNMFLLFPISKAIYVFIRSTIYIPICFYYFLNEIGTKTAMNYYLHSNMFLLFRSIIKEIFTECANLHSNMFLLFQMGIKIPPTFRLNLHSNMFLLFPATVKAAPYIYPNLHSNMFLLFLGCTQMGKCSDSHLHSNMFLLFQKKRTIAHIVVIHLHSNMFLLFRIRTSSPVFKVPIYIPICFYYFVNILILKRFNLGVFTFQYVSIISFLLPLFAGLSCLFTFQYVSIISSFCLYFAGTYANLHSNMFLLFLG